MLGALPTEPLELLAPDPLVPPAVPPPAVAPPVAAPGLAVVAVAPPALAVVPGEGAVVVVAGPLAGRASAAALESVVRLPVPLATGFLLLPPHAPSAAMTAMHSRIRRTQLPPHDDPAERLPAVAPCPPAEMGSQWARWTATAWPGDGPTCSSRSAGRPKPSRRRTRTSPITTADRAAGTTPWSTSNGCWIPCRSCATSPATRRRWNWRPGCTTWSTTPGPVTTRPAAPPSR